jgi:hypothetical protein
MLNGDPLHPASDESPHNGAGPTVFTQAGFSPASPSLTAGLPPRPHGLPMKPAHSDSSDQRRGRQNQGGGYNNRRTPPPDRSPDSYRRRNQQSDVDDRDRTYFDNANGGRPSPNMPSRSSGISLLDRMGLSDSASGSSLRDRVVPAKRDRDDRRDGDGGREGDYDDGEPNSKRAKGKRGQRGRRGRRGGHGGIAT